ncbi:MAG: hypothetical protein AB1758_18075 [Candidatus Eremiobacterota bacterium]
MLNLVDPVLKGHSVAFSQLPGGRPDLCQIFCEHARRCSRGEASDPVPLGIAAASVVPGFHRVAEQSGRWLREDDCRVLGGCHQVE